MLHRSGSPAWAPVNQNALRTEIASFAQSAPVILPTLASMEAVYTTQAGSPKQLLTGSAQMVKANALLSEFLGEVHFLQDDTSRDGMRIEI